MATYRDTREQLKERLRRDLALPQGELADAVLEAVVILASVYPTAVPAIANRYADLFCPYDDQLHRSTECDQKVKEHQEAVRVERI